MVTSINSSAAPAAATDDYAPVYVMLVAIAFVWGATRAPRGPLDRPLAIFLLTYWLIPLALSSNLSLYRAEALLLPTVYLARKLPLWVLLPMVLTALPLAVKMAFLFFKNVLV